MDKQQQILEMAKDICRVTHICNDVCKPISACDALKYAERAVEAGYSKQSEGRWEIVIGSHGKEIMICTNCRHSQDLHSTFTYCPNCGARMKGGNECVKGTPKKTYYTPDEVRNMSMNEIRDNITAIRKSMKRWRDE